MTNQNLQKLETAIREAFKEDFPLLESYKYNSLTKKTDTVKFHNPVTLLHLMRWLDIVCIEGTSNFDGTVWLKKTVIKLDYSKPLLSQQSQEVIDNLVKLVK